MERSKIIYGFLALSIVVFLGYIIHQYDINTKSRDAKRKIIQLRENKNISEDFINFPKYYINLDRSEDRRKNMEKEIKEYGLKNIKRVSAFDGRKLENRREGIIDGYEYKNISDKKCMKSEIAVTMSHIKAIQQACEDGRKMALIMEDDTEMTLVPHWGKYLNEITEEIPEECDILLMAIPNKEKPNNIKVISEKEKNLGRNGVAYIITKRGMKTIAKFLNNNVFDFHNYKEVLWDNHMMNDFNVYHTNATLFLPYNFAFNSDRAENASNFCPKSYKSLLKYF